MDRIIVHFKDDSLRFINIEATDIFEQGDYLHIYNDKDLVAILLISTIKIIYKSTMRDKNG